MYFLYTDGMLHQAPALQQMRAMVMLEDNPALGHAAILLFDAESESKAMLMGAKVREADEDGERGKRELCITLTEKLRSFCLHVAETGGGGEESQGKNTKRAIRSVANGG